MQRQRLQKARAGLRAACLAASQLLPSEHQQQRRTLTHRCRVSLVVPMQVCWLGQATGDLNSPRFALPTSL